MTEPITAPPAPLSDLDRRILSTLGSRMGVYMDRPSPWVPSIARSLSRIANRSDLAAVYVIGRLLDLADRGLVVTREGDGGVRLWRLTEAGCAALGTAHAAPTGSAREEPAEGTALMPIGDDLVDQTALLLGVDRFPPGPLRSAAVVGAAIASGYPADVIAALAAVAVEQLGAALEERGQTAARLARRGEDRSAALGRAAADALDAGSEVFGGSPPPAAPDPGAELLALRLEVGRLRKAITALCDRWQRARADGLIPASDYVRDLGPCTLLADLSAPPPDLGPLRELVAAGRAFGWHDPPTRDELQRLIDARRAVLAAYPSLAGEG